MLTTEPTLHNSNNERFVAINGKRFHYIWLRDNCLCPMCRESASFQIFFDISNLQEIVNPLSVESFFNYLKNPAYQYCFRLEAGDCILAQNFRVLHGRKAFDPSSGIRHLKTSYIAWDYFRAKHNFNQLRSQLRPDELNLNKAHDYYLL